MPAPGTPRPPRPPRAAAVHAAPRVTPAEARKPAKEQLKSARARAQAMQDRAKRRRHDHRARHNRYKNDPHPVVIILALGFIGALVAGALAWRNNAAQTVSHYAHASSEDHTHDHADAHDFPDLPMIDARILLVDDTTARLDATSIETLDHRLDLFAQHGAQFVARDRDESSIELLASYRNAIGAVPADSTDLIARTNEWIENHDDIDAVLLLSTEPRTATETATLVTPVFHTRLHMSDRTIPEMLAVLAGNGYTP
jgi:hypothetical protein